MITIEQAITDLKNHITFEDDGNACTTQGEVIILLESAKLEKSRLESDKVEWPAKNGALFNRFRENIIYCIRFEKNISKDIFNKIFCILLLNVSLLFCLS